MLLHRRGWIPLHTKFDLGKLFTITREPPDVYSGHSRDILRPSPSVTAGCHGPGDSQARADVPAQDSVGLQLATAVGACIGLLGTLGVNSKSITVPCTAC